MNPAKGLGKIVLEATVIRCRCGEPEQHVGAVCPQGVAEPIGEIGYWNRNPLARLAHSAASAIKKVLPA
jgi:hypothetical protein